METNPAQESLSLIRQARIVDTRLRHLDVDDLYLLSYLGDGKRLADAARSLSLSQPAITQRIHKIEQALGFDVLERASRITRLTEQGLYVCRRASEAVSYLEKFFEGRVPSLEAVAVTGAWAAWIIAGALSRLSDDTRAIDVEFISLDVMQSAARLQDGFGPVVATLHHRSGTSKVPGYSSVETIERPITLWISPDVVIENLKKPLPLIEVTRDDKLLDASSIREIELSTPYINGVRYAGTVAGAVQLASMGQGVLVAPQELTERHLGLVPASSNWKGSVAKFDLMVDERAPVVDLVAKIVAALK